MRRPAPTSVIEGPRAPQNEVRRSRFRLRLPFVAVALAVVAVAGATSACTPEMVAQQAIEQYWGPDLAPCAEKIAQRESNMEADAVNPRSGTTGLFQLHPVHTKWINQTFGYSFSDMKDPFKNAEVAKALSAEAYRMYHDGWQPWRLSGRAIRGGGCPA